MNYYTGSGFSQASNRPSGKPLSKRPKLELLTNSSSSGSEVNRNSTPDVYAELWGDDPDCDILEQVDLEETIALTQMQQEVQQSPRSQVVRNQVMKGNNKPVLVQNKESNKISSPRGVALRRTASSGWPTASNFSSPIQDNNVVTRTTNFEKKSNGFHSSHLELERLKNENKNLKNQLTMKTGEANLLRDRLATLQQENSKKEHEFLNKIENLKEETERKLSSCSKEIRSLKSQLEVKVMEMETAERKVHMNSMSRLLPESPNARLRNNFRPSFSPGNRLTQTEDWFTPTQHIVRTKCVTFLFELIRQQLDTPELLKPTQPEASIMELVRTTYNSGLFAGHNGMKQPRSSTSTSGHTSNSIYYTVHTNLNAEELSKQPSSPCSSVEDCILSVVSLQLRDFNSDNTHKVFSQVLESCIQILLEQLRQLQAAVSSQNKLEREREVLKCGHKHLTLTEDYNLLSCKELYNNERGLCARRVLALLSILCELSDFVTEKILSRCVSDQSDNKSSCNIAAPSTSALTVGISPKIDSHLILNVVRDIVGQIESQRRTLMFEGVLAAAVALIKSLFLSTSTLSLTSQDIIFDILRSVVFARPGSLVIHNILQALLAASKYSHFTSKLCHNSDSCVLQVLCTLLHLADTPRKHVLTDLFTSWVLTLFYGNGLTSPKWLSSVPQMTCQCRPLVSRLTLTLLGEACCIYPSVSATNNDRKLLEKVLTRGVLLVTTLLYNGDHFGVSEGYYELFLLSMSIFFENKDVRLNSSCRESLENLEIQEVHRPPAYVNKEGSGEIDLFKGFQGKPSTCEEVLELLD